MMRSVQQLYSLDFIRVLVLKLAELHMSPLSLLRWFWTTKHYAVSARKLSEVERTTAGLLGLLAAAQIIAGIAFLIAWARTGSAGSWEFGVALLISYPIVAAHLLALLAALQRMAFYVGNPKKLGREIVCLKLESQVKRLRMRHDFSVVAVAGSVGKTSTKAAIAQLLNQNLRVQWQEGNYNDRVTVPLVLFGHTEPSLFNVVAWFKLFSANNRIIRSIYPFDVVVVELGTDGPGQMKDFAYLQPNITVVTAISPEHMEYFGTLNAVAAEELTVFDYSETVLVNGDDIAGEYLAGRTFKEYSLKSKRADYYAHTKSNGLKGQTVSLVLNGQKQVADIRYIGEQGAKFALAAAGVAELLKISMADIAKGLTKLEHFAGRMQVLPGIQTTTLIDDTYNASPIAAKAALDVLYAAKTTQRIAILGSMNELGDYSETAHREVGAYCNPEKLDVVVTIGHDAETWLALAARDAGCDVASFSSPYDAGEFVKKRLKKSAVVLAKGSQNDVFAEEALKQLLANKADAKKLVRQSPYWLARKKDQFSK